MDEALRAAFREAVSSGREDAETRHLAALARAGELDQETLEFLAHMGSSSARALAPHVPELELGGLTRVRQALVQRATELLSDFRPMGIREFVCGQLSSRIAVLEHLPTGLPFALIPGGRFEMGSRTGAGFRGPKHVVQPVRSVRVAPFLLCQTPCTQAAWDRQSAQDDRRWRSPSNPIEGVSWTQAQVFLSHYSLRLPSEAEWEYACLAGSLGPYCFGDDVGQLDQFAWYRENSAVRTHPVALKLPNAFGLYDVHGNVREMCQDTWHATYDGAPCDGSPWEAPQTERGDDWSWPGYRVVRSGGWGALAEMCSGRSRGKLGPEHMSPDFSFRPALTVFEGLSAAL